MGGVGFVVGGGGGDDDVGGRVTAAVVITCIAAASGGLLFGYDIGISGGVTTMVPFLEQFFPSILEKAKDAEMNIYCVYDSHLLTAFTSSLYIAGLATCLISSRINTKMGRKFTILLGGFTFLLGGAINGAAQNVAMLIIGRIFLGFGVGFTNQATPLYLSEVAPPKWRGSFNTGFQFFIGIGVLAANFINLGVAKKSWGWRLSLGLAVAPALIMSLGILIISDTPGSLVERGKLNEARKALEKARGQTDVETELAGLINASQATKAAEEPFMTILETQYRPHLVMAIMIPFFQQLTGINIIAFYAPVLFQSVGFAGNPALLATVILGLVNLGSILVSTFIVDRCGRRFLFLEGGIQMFICQIAVAVILATKIGVSGTEHLSRGSAVLVLVLLCIYAAAFGWSWGPLNWLVPSEIFPMNIRGAGQSICIGVNFATTFILSQTFLAMLCSFKFGAFFFYAGWIAIMTIFVALFVPETKSIPLETMHIVWKQHWYWRRFVKGEV